MMENKGSLKMPEEIAALYHRVSTNKQTLEQHEMITKEYCNKNNITIFDCYSDAAQSGIKTSRPEIDRMKKDMRSKKFNIVITTKYDRLGRSTIDLLQNLAEMQKLNIRLIAVEQNIDSSTPMGKYFITNLCALADLEREMIIERTCDKLNFYKKELREKGFFINKKGEKCYSLGRPKGSKDKAYRKKGGYFLRYHK